MSAGWRFAAAIGLAVAAATAVVAPAAAVRPAGEESSAAPDGAVGRLAPALASRLAAARPDQLVDVIVQLDSQAGVGGSGPRARRLAATVRALRTHASRSQSGVLELLRRRRAGGRVADVDPLWISNAVRVRAAPSVIRELAARSDVRRISPNTTIDAPAPVTTAVAAAEPNLGLVNAPALWDLGFRGQGIVLASLDTGVDGTHPDLAAHWRGGTNSWYDPSGQHPTAPVDSNGHGTMTMGIMVGADAGGSAIGVAPEASWIAAKIFDDRGTSTAARIHQSFQWLLDPDGNPDTPDAPDVVNNSWSLSGGGCDLEFQPDLRALRAVGILPVFAAGNDGPLAASVSSPANNPEALAVGDTDGADNLYPYSGRGPSPCAGSVAPAITAPGVDVRSSDTGGGYAVATGTSLSAPHAAGGLALLLCAYGQLSASRQQAALEQGAADLGPSGVDADTGYGRLDLDGSYRWLATAPDFDVAADPPSAAVVAGAATAYTVTVSALNGFAADVSLSVIGLPAQATLSPATIPGGAGSSRLEIQTAAGLAPGSYPFTISGSSGGVAHTAAAILTVLPPPDFGLTASPPSATVNAGSSAGYTVAVSALNGFTGTAALTVIGLPTAVGAASLSPASVTGAGTSTLTVVTAPAAPAGSYLLTVTGTAGATAHAATVQLVVPPRDFALAVSPQSVSVTRGKTGKYVVTVTPGGGFAGTVGLTLTGLPTGVSATFSANPVSAGRASTLAVKTTTKAKRGTYPLIVTGRNGTLVHQATVVLTIQ